MPPDPRPYVSENFKVLFASQREADKQAREIAWGVVAEVTQLIPGFIFSQEITDDATALMTFYDDNKQVFNDIKSFEEDLERLTQMLGEKHGLIIKARKALELRESMGEEGWKRFLEDYFKDEALVYLLWARRMQRENIEHDLLKDEVVSRLEGDNSPIKNKLDLFERGRREYKEGTGTRMEAE